MANPPPERDAAETLRRRVADAKQQTCLADFNDLATPLLPPFADGLVIPPADTIRAVIAGALDAMEHGATALVRRAAWNALRDAFYPMAAPALQPQPSRRVLNEMKVLRAEEIGAALPPVEADIDLSALEQIDYVRRMLHWHTGPTAPEPYRGDHWASEIERLDEALEMLAPGRFTPLAMKPAPVEADTMPSLRDGDWVFVSAPDAPRDEIRQVVRGEIHSREWCYQPADVQEIRRDPLWRRSSPQEAPR